MDLKSSACFLFLTVTEKLTKENPGLCFKTTKIKYIKNSILLSLQEVAVGTNAIVLCIFLF